MDGPVAQRLVRCPEEGVEDLVRSQVKVARSIEAARALVGQVQQELRNAYTLLTSSHPPDPASLELTTRKLIRTAGLLARHLTERAAFEEALPTIADQILLSALLKQEKNLAGVRLEALRACARLIAAFPELMKSRMEALLAFVELTLRPPPQLEEAQLALEIVQLQLAHDPTLLLPRVPALLAHLRPLISAEPPSPFTALELLTVLAHLLDGCCDSDHFPVPAPALCAALETAGVVHKDSAYWQQLTQTLCALAAMPDHQSAALSALEAMGHWTKHYGAPAQRAEVQKQALTALLQQLDHCVANTEWQVLKACAGFVPGLAVAELDRLFAALEIFIKRLQNSNLKQAARDKQRKAAVTLATAMVRQYGAAIAPHVDRFQAAVLAPLRDPLLCSELISALAQDKAALKAFLPRLLSGLLPYAKSKETSWQLLREVYETLGLIATSAGRPAASFASEILAAVLATLPRALLHAGAEGLQCCCQVMLCEGVEDNVVNEYGNRVCKLIWNVLKEKYDEAEPLEEDEQEDEVDLDSTLMLEALDCAKQLITHPHKGAQFHSFAEALVDFLVGAILRPLLLDDDAALRVAQVEAVAELLVQRPKLRTEERMRKAKQGMTVAAGLLRDEEEENDAKEVERQIERLAKL